MQQSMKDIGQAPSNFDDESQLTAAADTYEQNYLSSENGIKIFYLVQQKK